ncbi:EHN domain-containing protein [Fusarium sp. Ph1]|nr:EHN domain-containing protein [Fusarium sp. Ph1]
MIALGLQALLASQLAALVAANHVPSTHGLNFDAKFGNKPQPFTIHVDQAFIDETKAKAEKTRLVVDMDQPDYIDGVPSHVVGNWSRYWAKEYD